MANMIETEVIPPPTYDESQALTVKQFEFGNIKAQLNVYGTNEDPLFLANDIGKLLGIVKIRNSIADYSGEEKKDAQIKGRVGGKQRATFLTEFGLYKVIMNARNNPVANSFQRWICTVIKEIRLTGEYKYKKQIGRMDELETEIKRLNELVLKQETDNVENDLKVKLYQQRIQNQKNQRDFIYVASNTRPDGVYSKLIDTKHCKIGTSRDTIKRIPSLRTGNPHLEGKTIIETFNGQLAEKVILHAMQHMRDKLEFCNVNHQTMAILAANVEQFIRYISTFDYDGKVMPLGLQNIADFGPDIPMYKINHNLLDDNVVKSLDKKFSASELPTDAEQLGMPQQILPAVNTALITNREVTPNIEAIDKKEVEKAKQKKLSNFYFVWENILKYDDHQFKDAMAYYTDKCVYNKETKKSTTIYRGYFKTNEIENLNTLPMHLHKRLPGIVIEASAGMDGFNVLHNNYELPPLSDAKQIGATKTYLGSDEDEYDEIYCFKNASDLDELKDFLELPKEETGLQFVADTYTKWQDMKDHLRFYGFKKLHQMPEEIFKKFSATAERLKSCHSCGIPRIARQKCCSEFNSNKRIGCLFIKGVQLIAT